MKKIVLSMAGVLAATAFAPEASALPAFARQTGLACSSCHFQHFPVLSTTGQEFKAGAYTQISAKGKFKGEDLSITDQLNGAILLKAKYVKTNGTDAAGTISGTTTNGGQWAIPDEFSLFFGGRIGDNGTVKVGYLLENGLTGNAVNTPGIAAGFKMPVAVSVADSASLIVVPFLTDSLGMAYGYDLSSGGIVRGIRWSEEHAATYAGRYTGLATGAASGIAYVINSSMGYVNLTRWTPQFSMAKDTGVQMSANWLRVAATPTVADWSMHIGVGIASGSAYTNATGVVPTAADKKDTKGTVIDVQAQGEVGGMEASFYFANSKTPKSAVGGMANYFNASTTNDLKATTVGADFSVIPHTLHVGAGYRKANNATGQKDDAILVQAVYDLFQNVALHASYTKFSGPGYTAGVASNKLSFMLESAW